jgi:hypothetical protein
MSSKPRYWDTKKGKVLNAIFKSKNRTWIEIQEATKYSEKELRGILKELFEVDEISKKGSSYWIEDYDLWCEYRDYQESSMESVEKQELRIQLTAFKAKWNPIIEYLKEKHPGKTIITNILSWTMTQNISFDPRAEHFFVEGDLLDQISKTAIDQAHEGIVIVNPFVDQCSLSDKLKTVSMSGKNITLITRSPASEGYLKVRKQRKAYHMALNQSGVTIFYNDRIHSKILLVDKKCGIVSSMNFKSESSSGKNLEAGLITWQKDTIQSLINYVTTLRNDFETKPYDG